VSWLGDYLEYTSEQESPEEFHFWTGLTLIAAALGRKVWLERRSGGVTHYKIYPGGLAVVLVAGSGWSRKTTASDFGMRLLRQVKQEINLDLVAGSISPEKLMKRLSLRNEQPSFIGTRVEPRDAHIFLNGDELAILLNKRSYNETMTTLLLKLLGAPEYHEHDTIGGSKVEARNICITFHGTTTPVGLSESVHTNVQSTGFTRRMIFVWSDRRRKANPLVDVDDEEVDKARLARVLSLEESLAKRLIEYSRLEGKIRYTPGGKEWFREWYSTYSSNPLNQTEGWPTSRPDHLLKIATLIRVSEFGDLLLDAGTLAAADATLSNVEADFDRVFQMVGQQQVARIIDRIERLLRKTGGRAPSRTIYNQMYRYFTDIEELKKALVTMREAGKLERLELGNVEYFALIEEEH